MFMYNCPQCSQQLSAAPVRVGQRTICPKCLKPIIIPTEEEAARDAVDSGTDDLDEMDNPSIIHVDPIVDTPLGQRTPEPRVPEPQPEVVLNLAPAVNGASYSSPTPVVPLVAERPARSAMDIAADLSSTITQRMKPPPEPPSDLRPTTAAWFILTTIGVVLWIVGLLFDEKTLYFLYLIGGLFVAFSYLWVAYLAGRWGHPWRGLVTLIPPVTLFRYFVPLGQYGHRPLISLLTGILFLVLGYYGPNLRHQVQMAFVSLDPDEPKATIPASNSAVDRIRAAVRRNQPDLMEVYLDEIAQSDDSTKATPEAKIAMAKELLQLLKSDRAQTRTAALKALVVWAPEQTREPILHALQSPSKAERRIALQQAVRWKDTEMANAIAEVARSTFETNERALAYDTLREIGAPHAESAVVQLLRPDDPISALALLRILEQIGTKTSVPAIHTLRDHANNPAVRQEADRVATLLEAKKG